MNIHEKSYFYINLISVKRCRNTNNALPTFSLLVVENISTKNEDWKGFLSVQFCNRFTV